jgi:hypothetical protein
MQHQQAPVQGNAGKASVICVLHNELTLGGRGSIQPSSKALSMMVASMDLMLTGSWLMPSTHAPCSSGRNGQQNRSHNQLVVGRQQPMNFFWLISLIMLQGPVDGLTAAQACHKYTTPAIASKR